MEPEVKPAEEKQEPQEKQRLDPIVLTESQINRLSKQELHNYRWHKGRFSLDPEERVKGEEERKNHIFHDLTRMITFSLFIALGVNDYPKLAVVSLVLFIISCAAAHSDGCDDLWLK